MTRRRKILIGVAAALLFANVVAALLAARQVSDVLWVSDIDPESLDFGLQYEGGILDDDWTQVVQLDRQGARQGQRHVPFSAIIDNVGKAEFERIRDRCPIDVHGTCVRSPWTARAVAERDTPMAVIIAASRSVRTICDVHVVVRTELEGQLSQFEGRKLSTEEADFELSSSKLDPPRFLRLLDWRAAPQRLMQREGNETLEQFGERTGCARISPLRP